MKIGTAEGAVGMVTFHQPPAGITFSTGNKPVFSITGDGRLEAGEGLSNDEATRALFDVIAKNVPCFIRALRERAEKAEAELAALRDRAETEKGGNRSDETLQSAREA